MLCQVILCYNFVLYMYKHTHTHIYITLFDLTSCLSIIRPRKRLMLGDKFDSKFYYFLFVDTSQTVASANVILPSRTPKITKILVSKACSGSTSGQGSAQPSPQLNHSTRVSDQWQWKIPVEKAYHWEGFQYNSNKLTCSKRYDNGLRINTHS